MKYKTCEIQNDKRNSKRPYSLQAVLNQKAFFHQKTGPAATISSVRLPSLPTL